MKSIVLPEIIIYNALESIIKCIRKDFENNTEDKNTILYKLLGVDEEGKAVKLNLYDYFKQAKKMFTSPKNLTVNIGYNWETAKFISLHIILPSETPIDSAIGEDEGYQTEIDDNGNIQEKFCQMFGSNYQIMITSENSNEVNLVYHIMKSMLIAIIPHLSLMGLLNPKLSGNDIMFQEEGMPIGRFQRVINLNFQYELVVPQLIVKEVVKNLNFIGHPLENIKYDCPFEDNE